MHIVKNKDPEAKEVEQAIANNGGYCCCQIKSEDTKCICKNFKDKLNDDSYYGSCDCGLFTKTK